MLLLWVRMTGGKLAANMSCVARRYLQGLQFMPHQPGQAISAAVQLRPRSEQLQCQTTHRAATATHHQKADASANVQLLTHLTSEKVVLDVARGGAIAFAVK